MTGLGRPGIWWLACVLLFLSRSVEAQFGGFNNFPAMTPEQSLWRRVPREARTLGVLGQGQSLIDAQDYQAAIDLLQPLLESTEDFFEFDAALNPVGSVLDRTESLLRGLPPEAIEIYRRQYEPLAEQLFKEARRSGELSDYLEVANHFPLTASARSALREATAVAFDMGETAVAARLRERLLVGAAPGAERTKLLIEIARDWTMSGQPELAQAHVLELSALARQTPIEFEGKLLTPPESADAAWLNKVFGPVPTLVPRRSIEWRISGGHPRHWSDGRMVSPIERGHWSYPLIDRYDTRHYEDVARNGQAAPRTRHDKLLGMVKELETRYLVNKSLGSVTPIVAGSPLVDRGVALVQGLGTVKAVDLKTGRLRWSGVVEDNTFLYWVSRCLQDDSAQTGILNLFLGQRIWLNQTAASLSSDGSRVYAISGTGMFGLMQRNPFMGGRGPAPRGELSPANENRLLAYDIQTGRLKWELGGYGSTDPAQMQNPFGPGEPGGQNSRLSGAYFLGAPLAVEGRLYAMAEDRGQIRLFSLIPETGEVEWSLALVNPDESIEADEGRRIAGLTPTYAGGLLVCPTGEGVVLAIDPLRRRAKWVHQYRPLAQAINPRGRGFRMARDRFGSNPSTIERLLKERRWFDSSVLATAGRVIVPTVDDHTLVCLELETGKPVWSVPRSDGLFVAACTGRQCLIAGERTIQSIRVSDGTTVWSREIPTSAGRGVVVSGKYLLPTSTREVLAIEISSGKVLARLEMDPAHSIGSLIAAGDQLLMQTPAELIGFRTLTEVTQELATQLKDPASRPLALVEQSELLLTQGKDAEAVAMLRESIQLQESDTTRKLLVWSLLDRLKSDFSGNRKLVPELKMTVRDPGQRKLLTRLNAEGMEQAGEYLQAFQEYLQLVPDVSSQDEYQIEVTPELHVREDRWLRGRLTHLYRLADPEPQARMRAMIAEAHNGRTVVERRQLAHVLGIELAPQLHLDLALERVFDDSQGKDFLGKRVLWTLTESDDLTLRGPAIARLIRDDLAANLGLKSLVPTLIPQLEQELANVVCEPGLTGAEFLKSLREDTKLGQSLAALAPRGVPDVEPVFDVAASGVLIQRDLIPILGPRRGVFGEWAFSMESSSTGTIWCSDPHGRDRFSCVPQSIGIANDRLVRYIQTDAQLALIVFRDQFAVVNPHETTTQPKCTGVLNNFPNFNQRFGTPNEPKPGVRDKLYRTMNNTFSGNVGPLLYDTLIYQTQEGRETGDIVATVPFMRKQDLWRRSGLPVGCEILADAQFVILIPPARERLIVLRTSDGVQIAERRFPAKLVERRRAEWGRLFLTSPESPPGGNSDVINFAMYDPVTDKNAWTHSFPKGTLWSAVNGEDLAFLEPDGKVTLIDDQTGRKIWTSQFPPAPSPWTQFQIHADHQRLYIHTWHEPTEDQEPVRIDPQTRISLAAQISSVNGLVVSLDRRSGEVVWSRTIDQQIFRETLPIGTGLLAYSATRQKKGGKPFQSEYSLTQLLDRSTGKPVFEKELPSGTIYNSWKLLHNGVLRVRLTGHDFDLSWKQMDAADQQSEPITEPDKQNIDPPIKLQ